MFGLFSSSQSSDRTTAQSLLQPSPLSPASRPGDRGSFKQRFLQGAQKTGLVFAKFLLGLGCYLIHPEIFYLGFVAGAVWSDTFSEAGTWVKKLCSHNWYRLVIFGGLTMLTATMGFTCLCFLSAAYLGSQLLPLSAVRREIQPIPHGYILVPAPG